MKAAAKVSPAIEKRHTERAVEKFEVLHAVLFDPRKPLSKKLSAVSQSFDMNVKARRLYEKTTPKGMTFITALTGTNGRYGISLSRQEVELLASADATLTPKQKDILARYKAPPEAERIAGVERFLMKRNIAFEAAPEPAAAPVNLTLPPRTAAEAMDRIHLMTANQVAWCVHNVSATPPGPMDAAGKRTCRGAPYPAR